MIPSVAVSKSDGNTGVVRPSSDGILAIIAPCQSGTTNQPSSFTRQDLALAAFGYGKLTETAAYHLAVSKKPVVLIRGTGSATAANGTTTNVGAGTSVVSASGVPLDDYLPIITIVAGGTIGAAGITLKHSLDGGVNYSGTIALGTAVTFTIPNSGIIFAFAAGTLLAGQTASFLPTGPRLTNADLVAALESLRTYGGRYESILVTGMDITATDVATLDLWLSAREAEGKYKTAVVNTLPRTSAQTEAQYLTAMTTAFAAASSTRVMVCADAGEVVSVLRGGILRQPVSMGLAARGMLYDISVDLAYVANGPIAGYTISDVRDNPKYHDEALYPGLDDIRLATLRTVPGRNGAYCNNPVLISPAGSDYVYWQHARVMNRACEITFELLTNRLSQGVNYSLTTGFITEEDASEIEGLVNAELGRQLKSRVTDSRFIINRTDDLRTMGGATLNCELQIAPLSYVKKFAVNAKFVKTITVSATT